jgi:hypothetical protein
VNRYLKICFSNACDLSGNIYQTGWQQSLYLDCELTRPKYECTTEMSKSGLKAVFRKVIKRTSFTCVLPAYLVDIVNMLPVLSYTVCYDLDGNALPMRNMEVSTTWVNECFATVTVSFEAVNVVNTGCCHNRPWYTPVRIDNYCTYFAIDTTSRRPERAPEVSFTIFTTSATPVPITLYWGDGAYDTINCTGNHAFLHDYTEPTGRNITGNFCIPQDLIHLVHDYSVYVNFCTLTMFMPPKQLINMTTYNIGLDVISGFSQITIHNTYIHTTEIDIIAMDAAHGPSGVNSFYLPTTLVNVNLINLWDCDITDLEQALTTLDANGVINGTFDAHGGTTQGFAALSAASLTARTNLLAKGWTITLNA